MEEIVTNEEGVALVSRLISTNFRLEWVLPFHHLS